MSAPNHQESEQKDTLNENQEDGSSNENDDQYEESDEEDDDPPSTQPGSLIVSRIVWEVVRTCDVNIRNDFATQIKNLLEILTKLNVSFRKVPKDLKTVHRLIWESSQLNWKLSQVKEEYKIWTKYHMYKKYEEAIDYLQSTLRPVAASWHSARRCEMLKRHPEIALLLRDDPITLIVMTLIIILHLFIALFLNHSFFDSSGFFKIFMIAYLIGSFLSFGFQALDHELSHTISTPLLSNILGLIGSGCTLVPWYSYYFSGGHERHHKFAGTPKDIDREAFFWAWEKTPKCLDFPMGSVIWASLIGLGLPVLYVFSLLYCVLGNWRANIKELKYFSIDMVVTMIIHGYVYSFTGWKGLFYLILSMGFGNGFLLHPLIAFWIMQHLCHKTSISRDDKDDDNEYISLQPTLSYQGSRLWNWLNFNELSHVEHHDFSRIPWTKTNQLRSLAPEFYSPDHIHSITSIRHLLYEWVMTKGEKMNFACIRAEAPPRLSSSEIQGLKTD